MTLCSRCAAFLLIAVSLMAGCATPPPAELDTARRAIESAKGEGAADHAAHELCQAQRALAKGETFLRQQNSDQALTAFDQTTKLADQASAKTNQQRSATQDYQQQLQQLSSEGRIDQLKQSLAAAETQKAAHSPQSPPPPVTIVKKTTAKSEPAKPRITSYTVGEGENLYAIAAKQTIYNEGLLWPLIYRANRDQIKDPQQIFPDQILSIPRNLTEEELESARETARTSGIFLN
ncbi:MAG: LysM peptidoglycan-binding domain-containing protein [Desulfuromonas sp.]|nr:LysM peptidoglycan-binding domain-containing protein [Desulfuromonas sp.]